MNTNAHKCIRTICTPMRTPCIPNRLWSSVAVNGAVRFHRLQLLRMLGIYLWFTHPWCTRGCCVSYHRHHHGQQQQPGHQREGSSGSSLGISGRAAAGAAAWTAGAATAEAMQSLLQKSEATRVENGAAAWAA